MIDLTDLDGNNSLPQNCGCFLEHIEQDMFMHNLMLMVTEQVMQIPVTVYSIARQLDDHPVLHDHIVVILPCKYSQVIPTANMVQP